jgi:hypothetical protein
MATYEVDDELALVVEKIARKRPFETLTFQEALWRVIREHVQKAGNSGSTDPLEDLMTEVRTQISHGTKKASPSVMRWVESVPDLRKHRHLTTWKAVCDHLKVNPGADSARRKLMKWVHINKPDWPPVPDVD